MVMETQKPGDALAREAKRKVKPGARVLWWKGCRKHPLDYE